MKEMKWMLDEIKSFAVFRLSILPALVDVQQHLLGDFINTVHIPSHLFFLFVRERFYQDC
jgi:hypothetical protein